MDTNDGIIYKYTSPSGKIYIGQTRNIKQRICIHKKASGSSPIFHNAIKKYGYNALAFEILHSNIYSQKCLDLLEILEIKNNKSLSPNGYNLSMGGYGISLVSIETRNKLSKSLTGKKASSIAKINMGKWKRTDELKRKIGLKSKGRKHTLATRKKMSIVRTGEKRSYETILKLRDRPNCKSIRCIQTGIIYTSYKEAERETGIWNTSIGLCARGKLKQAGGFTWELVSQ